LNLVQVIWGVRLLQLNVYCFKEWDIVSSGFCNKRMILQPQAFVVVSYTSTRQTLWVVSHSQLYQSGQRGNFEEHSGGLFPKHGNFEEHFA
jgi:hypothetical protein